MTTYDGCATDHVMKFPRPPPSVFAYCKHQHLEGLGVKLILVFFVLLLLFWEVTFSVFLSTGRAVLNGTFCNSTGNGECGDCGRCTGMQCQQRYAWMGFGWSMTVLSVFQYMYDTDRCVLFQDPLGTHKSKANVHAPNLLKGVCANSQ